MPALESQLNTDELPSDLHGLAVPFTSSMHKLMYQWSAQERHGRRWSLSDDTAANSRSALFGAACA